MTKSRKEARREQIDRFIEDAKGFGVAFQKQGRRVWNELQHGLCEGKTFDSLRWDCNTQEIVVCWQDEPCPFPTQEEYIHRVIVF